MKIIAKSNFDDETVSDITIATSVAPAYASEIADYLNTVHNGKSATYYFVVVVDTYKLHRFEG